MNAHSSKPQAVKVFIEHEGWPKEWIIRVGDADGNAIIRLDGYRDDEVETEPKESFELNASEVQLEDDELDESTKTKIREWLSTLS